MTKNLSYFIFSLLITFVCFSCEKDDPVVPDTPELITTLNYTLTPSTGGSTVVLSFTDPDGDGGNNPTIVGGTLEANQTYTGSLDLLNESAIAAESITEEIQEEDEAHQFFFQTDIANLSVAYADQDSDGNPIGLMSTLTTGDATSGILTITLRHEPNKDATGVMNGDIDNAGGETDIEVTFPIDVQ